MAWRKPRFKLIHLVALVAASGVILAVFPNYWSMMIVALVVLICFLSSINDRISLLEWLIVLAIFVVLIALMLPAMTSHRGKPPKVATPVPTPPPLSVP